MQLSFTDFTHAQFLLKKKLSLDLHDEFDLKYKDTDGTMITIRDDESTVSLSP